MYSLLSTGTQYRLPARSRGRTQVLLTTRNGFNQLQPPAELRGTIQTRSGGAVGASSGYSHRNAERQTDASVLGADVRQYLLVTGQPRRLVPAPRSLPNPGQPVFVTVRRQSQQARHNVSAAAAFSTVHEFSGSGVPRGGRSTPGEGAGTGPDAAPALPSPNFTHSRGGRIINIPGTSESISRLPAAAGMPGISEDPGNAHRSQRTGPGDSRTGARSQPRTALEPNVSPTARPTNAVEINLSRPRQGASRSTEPSDSRDPHSIHHRNSVFYNLYPPDHRNRVNVRPPGHGHGTRFFDNGEVERTHLFGLRSAVCVFFTVVCPQVSQTWSLTPTTSKLPLTSRECRCMRCAAPPKRTVFPGQPFFPLQFHYFSSSLDVTFWEISRDCLSAYVHFSVHL